MSGDFPTEHGPKYGPDSVRHASDGLKGLVHELKDLLTLTVDRSAEVAIDDLGVLRGILKAALSAESAHERERRLEHAKAVVDSLIEENRSIRRRVTASHLMSMVPGRSDRRSSDSEDEPIA